MAQKLIFNKLLFLILLASCVNNSSDLDDNQFATVILIEFDINDNFQRVTNLDYSKIEKDDSIRYLYKLPEDPDSLFYYRILISTINDSLLILENIEAKLINNRGYTFHSGPTWFIKKYFSDVGGIADGEEIIYMNDSLGLIGIQSQAWGNYIIMDYGIEELTTSLLNDSTFFNAFSEEVPK